jgi:tetratricopeptide (TPR) repeat protein
VDALTPPDSHHLSAALGWLDLGNAAEAELEWLRISPANQLHPDALETGFAIHAARHDWERALPLAGRLVEAAPERAGGWLHRSYALRRTAAGGLQAARDALLPALELFPDEPVVPFNLACYACQLGDNDRAWAMLQRALAIGGRRLIVPMALADDDLAPLRERIATEWLPVNA